MNFTAGDRRHCRDNADNFDLLEVCGGVVIRDADSQRPTTGRAGRPRKQHH